ncbi:MAG: hypothetical protein QG665_390 [Patescibacteria group bacterium]|nr:hypothetical protein [Patescibacteria group bacterium]
MSKDKVSTTDTDMASTTDPDLSGAVPADGEYVLSTSETKIEWTGTKTLIADYKDTGTIGLKSGSFTLADGNVASGTIVFDMKTIAGTETSNKTIPITNLATHLMSPDFFDVAKYPTATFVVTEAEVVGGSAGAFILTGDLELKGVKNEIQIPIKLADADGQVAASGVFTIDRTKWGIKYGSGKFFKDLGDKVIADNIDIQFVATAAKK